MHINTNIHPLPYAIPDECIIREMKPKTRLLSQVNPNDRRTYIFNHTQEKEYDESYQEAKFAITTKKGGWDCLRHYEILANGCIPLFENLEECPSYTMFTFPKETVIFAKNIYHRYLHLNKEKGEEEKEEQLEIKEIEKDYEECVKNLLEHTRKYCSTSTLAKYFLRFFPSIKREGKEVKILMLRTNPGINYTRETLWIGLSNLFEGKGKLTFYPESDFFYDNYPIEKCKDLYGFGFKYARKIPREYNVTLTGEEVRKSILDKEWDIIIYGKIGVWEGETGTLPNLPFWSEVKEKYSSKEIAFLYGGDAQQTISGTDRESRHLMQHSKFAQCFVRELNTL